MRCLLSVVSACALAASAVEICRAEEPGHLLEDAERVRAISVEALRREVQVTIEQSRKSPGNASVDALKRLNDVVRMSVDLSASDRAVLQQQLTTALRQSQARLADEEAAAQQRLANQAAARDRERALAAIGNREERLRQLTDRFNALLSEARYELAESVAATAEDTASGEVLADASLPVNIGLKASAARIASVRADRQKGVVDTLYRSELAHVPQSDEPPIVYIPADEWQELTLRRSKYSTDMYQESPAEVRIRKALDEITGLDVVEVPLGDVMTYLKDRHGIEIQLDVRALEEIGSGSDVPVTLSIQGVSLRSALRVLLRQLDLTYTIQDEVLLITTPEKAASIIVPHVYKVGDVVVPIKDFGFAGGFGGIGGGNSNGLFGAGPNQNGGQQNQNNFNPFNNQNANPFGQDANNNFF